jgi:hypothetical protein
MFGTVIFAVLERFVIFIIPDSGDAAGAWGQYWA